MKKEETKNKQTKKSETKDKKERNTKKKVEEVVEIEVLDEENTSVDNNDVKEVKSKKDLFLILGLVLVLVLGFFVMSDKNAGPSYELPLVLSGDAGLQELTYKEYKKKIDNCN